MDFLLAGFTVTGRVVGVCFSGKCKDNQQGPSSVPIVLTLQNGGSLSCRVESHTFLMDSCSLQTTSLADGSFKFSRVPSGTHKISAPHSHLTFDKVFIHYSIPNFIYIYTGIYIHSVTL